MYYDIISIAVAYALYLINNYLVRSIWPNRSAQTTGKLAIKCTTRIAHRHEKQIDR